MSLVEMLFLMQDIPYQAFQRKLIPNIDPETIIGVRTPQLRRIAKELCGKTNFLNELPHRFFEENQIHAFILALEPDFDKAVAGVDAFLPCIDNWATCDQLRPKAFAKHHDQLLPYIQKWLQSGETYTIRFGMGMLMCHFLDEDFCPEYLLWVSSVFSEDYYVKMMAAWYFATALAKQYDTALPYITERRLDPWTHKRAIQKAVESFRITREQKLYLKQFR